MEDGGHIIWKQIPCTSIYQNLFRSLNLQAGAAGANAGAEPEREKGTVTDGKISSGLDDPKLCPDIIRKTD